MLISLVSGLDKLNLSNSTPDAESGKHAVNGHQKTLWEQIEPFSHKLMLCVCSWLFHINSTVVFNQKALKNQSKTVEVFRLWPVNLQYSSLTAECFQALTRLRFTKISSISNVCCSTMHCLLLVVNTSFQFLLSEKTAFSRDLRT